MAIHLGHYHRYDQDGWCTGTSVIVVPGGAVAAVDVRGGGPGTRETDVLKPSNSVQRVHAVVLTGGSAFGLAAADGAMAELERRHIGLPMSGDDDSKVVPIVPAAVIFDLPVGKWVYRPTAEFGRRAVINAMDSASDAIAEQGNVGGGTGARAGALKGGFGTASKRVTWGEKVITLTAYVVANPVGSVIDPSDGSFYGDPTRAAPTQTEIAQLNQQAAKSTVLNTTIGAIVTDADLDPAACERIAIAGQDGIARAVRPAHSPLDGDTIFALSTGEVDVSAPDGIPSEFAPTMPALTLLSVAAADAVELAIVNAVWHAESTYSIPSYRSIVQSASRA